jgi:hypothetical protein
MNLILSPVRFKPGRRKEGLKKQRGIGINKRCTEKSSRFAKTAAWFNPENGSVEAQ